MMAVSLPRHAVEPGPLSITQIEELIVLLPAAARASLAWVPPALRAAVSRVQVDHPTVELVTEAAVDFVEASHALWPALLAQFGKIPALQATYRAATEENVRRLRNFLADGGAQDGVEWALRATRATFELALAIAPAEFGAALRAPEKTELEKFARSAEASMLRAQLAVVAIMDLAERDERSVAASALAEIAYDEAQRGIELFRGQGVEINPFGDETPDGRGARLLRYVQRIRESLTDDERDWLDEARLKDLR